LSAAAHRQRVHFLGAKEPIISEPASLPVVGQLAFFQRGRRKRQSGRRVLRGGGGGGGGRIFTAAEISYADAGPQGNDGSLAPRADQLTAGSHRAFGDARNRKHFYRPRSRGDVYVIKLSRVV